jgi:hypothetical protein
VFICDMTNFEMGYIIKTSIPLVKKALSSGMVRNVTILSLVLVY